MPVTPFGRQKEQSYDRPDGDTQERTALGVNPRLATFIRGLVFLIGGILLIAEYVVQAIIERWGQADQSLLFWLLILPMLGLPLIAAGCVLIYRSIRR